MFSDDRILNALNTILENEEFKWIIAYARVYYLKETRMDGLYSLNDTAGPTGRETDVEFSVTKPIEEQQS